MNVIVSGPSLLNERFLRNILIFLNAVSTHLKIKVRQQVALSELKSGQRAQGLASSIEALVTGRFEVSARGVQEIDSLWISKSA